MRSVFSIGLYLPRLGLTALILIPTPVQSQSVQLDERGLTQRKTDTKETWIQGYSSGADETINS